MWHRERGTSDNKEYAMHVIIEGGGGRIQHPIPIPIDYCGRTSLLVDRVVV